MLEILGIVLVCRKVAQLATDRGRSAPGWVAMAVAFWLVFEFTAILGLLIVRSATGAVVTSGLDLGVLAAGLLGGAVGGGLAIAVVGLLPKVSLTPPRAFPTYREILSQSR